MRLFLILILIGFNFSLLSQSDDEINLKFIENSEWNNKGKLYSYGNLLIFQKKGVFKEEFAGEGGCEFYGIYNIVDSKLVLKLNAKQSCESEIKPEKERSCSIRIANDDPFYNKALVCNSMPYYHNQFLKSYNEIIEINGIKAEIIKERVVKTDVNLKIREKPEIESSYYKCLIEGRDYDFMPKGSRFRIFARTIEKIEINGNTDYWYYVEPILDWYSGCSDGKKYVNRAWAFGAFFK
ncbi:hypothetical protein [Leptospira bandrabouensis]|uniref:hypothetical protein n=1 Tax=Leptospira bandrabouensis TaxID=2484903 RepID=UPI001EE806E7|nr:hypothetical protein [Leptospira bandrabouensis]MCG6146632.1 hypothetical protein [Leptospira bandrabouensis]MCG6162023.1 hypothetical protein [Leptospira bandrabouensis]MCG6166226.1 hypothetical protein [Leptospira bandrabouensis]